MEDIYKSNFKITCNIKAQGNQFVYCSGNCRQECSRKNYKNIPPDSYVVADISPYCKDFIQNSIFTKDFLKNE